MKKGIKKIALPKWSAMVVKGKSVTEEQAAEIIVRTDSAYFNNNDEEFCKKLNREYFGYAVEAHQVTDAIMEDKKCTENKERYFK